MKILRIGSVTKAAKAKELLLKNGIKATIKKLSDYEGCVNAIVTAQQEVGRAQYILSENGIKSVVIDLQK